MWLRLDGTIEVILPNEDTVVVPLERLTRLYDSAEQLEDMWGDDEGTIEEGEDVEVWEMDQDGHWVEGTLDEDEDEWESADEEMDCLINAATRPFKCYRKPISAFYENDRLNAEVSCKTSMGEACPRCTLHPSPICCSLCSPSHPLFAILPPIGETLDKPKVARASQVDSQYRMTAKDTDLRAALHMLRREHTVRLYSLAHLHELGLAR
ncbi:hypothetical protein NUW54_g6708 [Trametes sanguinea]|uniref:Uncharacterized protein n=1 Tax=Trametes sanguinea TaxID=158606 RepID=A0ACC1PTK5_9APHY|nr:hypothetical protein NUW54_g6708 [Trametes sanguinea]